MNSIKRLKKKVGFHLKQTSQNNDQIPDLHLTNPRQTWSFEEAEPSEGDPPCKVYFKTCELGFLSKYSAPDPEDLEEFVVELKTLKTLGHVNLQKTLAAFYWESDLWVIRERSLQSYDLVTVMATLGPLSEPQLSYVAVCACKALQHLHNNLIIHRDINSRNISVGVDGTVKVGGLAICVKLKSREDQLSQSAGSAYWMAPEMALADAKMATYGLKVDIWSLGITVLELAEGEPPHFSTPPRRVLTKIVKSTPPTLLNPHKFSRQLSEFLSQCLVTDPGKRAEARRLLEHPFFLESSGTAASVRGLVLDYMSTHEVLGPQGVPEVALGDLGVAHGVSEGEQGIPGVDQGVPRVAQGIDSRTQEYSSQYSASSGKLLGTEHGEEPRHSLSMSHAPILSKFSATEETLNKEVSQEHISELVAHQQESTSRAYNVTREDDYQPSQSKKKLQRLHVNMTNKSNSLHDKNKTSTSLARTQDERLHENSKVTVDLRTSYPEVVVVTGNIISSVEEKHEETVPADQIIFLFDKLKKSVTFSPSTKSAVSDCFPREDGDDRWLSSNDDDPFTVYCPETDDTSLFVTSKSNSTEYSSMFRPGEDDRVFDLSKNDASFPTVGEKILSSPTLKQIDSLNILTPHIQSNELISSPPMKEDFSQSEEGGAREKNLMSLMIDDGQHRADDPTTHADSSVKSSGVKLPSEIVIVSGSSENVENLWL